MCSCMHPSLPVCVCVRTTCGSCFSPSTMCDPRDQTRGASNLEASPFAHWAILPVPDLPVFFWKRTKFLFYSTSDMTYLLPVLTQLPFVLQAGKDWLLFAPVQDRCFHSRKYVNSYCAPPSGHLGHLGQWASLDGNICLPYTSWLALGTPALLRWQYLLPVHLLIGTQDPLPSLDSKFFLKVTLEYKDSCGYKWQASTSLQGALFHFMR